MVGKGQMIGGHDWVLREGGAVCVACGLWFGGEFYIPSGGLAVGVKSAPHECKRRPLTTLDAIAVHFPAGLTEWLPKADAAPLVGLDRAKGLSRRSSPPPWRERLYRACRALLGDFG